MNVCRKVYLLSVAMLATAGALGAASGGASPKAPKPDVAPASNSDLQKLIQQFKTRRDALLANRDALLNQLKNATEDQKKAILEKMQAQQKELMDAQRALGRQLRDEMRKLRQLTPPGSGRH